MANLSISEIKDKFSQIQLPSANEFYFDKSTKWVKYGNDNLFPQLLIDLQNRSALHQAIISSKVDYSFANGLDTTDFDENLSLTLFIKHPNPHENLNSIYRKIINDFVLFNGYCLEIIWDNNGEFITQLNHIPFDKIRCGRQKNGNVVEYYYYCNDWKNYTLNKPIKIKRFDLNDRSGRQLFYYKDYHAGMEFYPLPSYVGALNYIAVDGLISNFHLAHIENGMNPSMMITFCNGIPEEEERRIIKRKINEEYTGSDNAGKIIVQFAKDSESAPKIDTLTADNLDEQFIQLQDTVLQHILSGHKVVSPMLVGIKTEGQLGGASELKNSYKIYYKTVICNIQQIILNSLNNLLRYTFDYNDGELKPTEPTIDFED